MLCDHQMLLHLTHRAFKVIIYGLLKVCELMKIIAGICRATWEQRSWILVTKRSLQKKSRKAAKHHISLVLAKRNVSLCLYTRLLSVSAFYLCSVWNLHTVPATDSLVYSLQTSKSAVHFHLPAILILIVWMEFTSHLTETRLLSYSQILKRIVVVF